MSSRRSYSLVGEDARIAVESGLASGRWYRSEIGAEEMKELLERSDGPAVRDTLLWVIGLLVTGGLMVVLWPSVWCLPVVLVYGVLYGSASDSRWHECGHGTAFKTAWMNTVVYQVACFMIMRNPAVWRSSHRRHHANTYIVGRDPEIQVKRPPSRLKILFSFTGIPDAWLAIKLMLLNAGGKLDSQEEAHLPEIQRNNVFRIARIWLLIYATVIAMAFLLQSILPLMLVGLPRLYGGWHQVMTGLLQHGGLDDNVLDHRLNSRTVYMNPFSRFIYWNMNYHIEHHMFPMVPYHALPRLHDLIRKDCPDPTPSITTGLREIWPVFKHQARDPDYCLTRELPATARPYAH